MECNSITDSAPLSNGSDVSGLEGPHGPSYPCREFTLTWDGRTKKYVRYNIPGQHDRSNVGEIGLVEIQRANSGSTQELLSEVLEEDCDSGDSDVFTPFGLPIVMCDGDIEFLLAEAMNDHYEETDTEDEEDDIDFGFELLSIKDFMLDEDDFDKDAVLRQ